jgi:hypothetical protein
VQAFLALGVAHMEMQLLRAGFNHRLRVIGQFAGRQRDLGMKSLVAAAVQTGLKHRRNPAFTKCSNRKLADLTNTRRARDDPRPTWNRFMQKFSRKFKTGASAVAVLVVLFGVYGFRKLHALAADPTGEGQASNRAADFGDQFGQRP